MFIFLISSILMNLTWLSTCDYNIFLTANEADNLSISLLVIWRFSCCKSIKFLACFSTGSSAFFVLIHGIPLYILDVSPFYTYVLYFLPFCVLSFLFSSVVFRWARVITGSIFLIQNTCHQKCLDFRIFSGFVILVCA